MTFITYHLCIKIVLDTVAITIKNKITDHKLIRQKKNDKKINSDYLNMDIYARSHCMVDYFISLI